MSQGILNNIKGFSYEHYIKSELIKANSSDQVWLWNECPVDLLIKNKVFQTYNNHRLHRLDIKNNVVDEIIIDSEGNQLKDIGIDLVKLSNDELIMIQCKNYKNSLTINDLAGFNFMISRCPHLLFELYYTNKLSTMIDIVRDVNEKTKYIKKIFPHDPIEYTLANIPEKKHFVTNYLNRCIEENIQPITTVEIVKLLPKKRGSVKIKIVEDNVENVIEDRQYQIDAIKAVYLSLVKNSRAILSLPCGLGKTYIAYNVSMNYDVVILFSPLMQHAKQNLDRFVQYNPEIECQLVDSDSGGTRDIDKLIKFINSEGKKFLFSTYKSADVILKICEYFASDNFLIIIDEFHNLSAKNISDENDAMYQLLKRKLNVMSMSATPRIYELENEEIDVTDLLGEISYNMSFSDAIKNKLVCDYKIYLPLIVENVKENHTMIQKEVDITNVNLNVLDKCSFMCCSIVDLGFRHIICYFQEHADIDEFIKTFKIANEFYALDNAIINKITCETKHKDREIIIDKFRLHDGVSILCSVRILDECIDIKECDSIFVTYPCKNKIKMVQRLNRCTRTDKLKPKKNCGMLLWCDEGEDIAYSMGSLKEYDPDLVTKVGVRNKDSNIVRANNKVVLDEQTKQTSKFIVGIKVYREIKFEEWFQLLEKFTNEFCRTPKNREVYDENKNIGGWYRYIKTKIKDNKDNIYIKFSKNKVIKLSLDNYFVKREMNKDKVKLTWNQWYELLIKHININNSVPKKDVLFEDYALGSWYMRQKECIENNTDELYLKLSKNSYVEASLNEYLSIKNNKKQKIKLKPNEKINLLIEFININERHPAHNEQFKGVDICSLFQKIKSNITDKNDESYIKLSANVKIKKILDKHIEPEAEWLNYKKLLFSHIEQYGTILTASNNKNEDDKDLIAWFTKQKQNITSVMDEVYIKLSENKTVKKMLDQNLAHKEKTKNIKKRTFDEYRSLLFSFCNTNMCYPKKNEQILDDDMEVCEIGNWFSRLKDHVQDVADKKYIILSKNQYVKEALNDFLTKKKDRVKLTFEEYKECLFKFADEFQKLPLTTDIYESISIGSWWYNHKHKIKDTKDELYIKFAENAIVRENINKYLEKINNKINEK